MKREEIDRKVGGRKFNMEGKRKEPKTVERKEKGANKKKSKEVDRQEDG